VWTRETDATRMTRLPLSTPGRRLRALVGIGFLVFQLYAIARARFVPSRYFAWAPYDAISLYELDVRIDGRLLTTDEVRARYELPSLGRDNRAIQHVIDAVRQYEATYGVGDDATVLLRYRTNGGPERSWRWPDGAR